MHRDSGIIGSIDSVHALPAREALPVRGRVKRGDVLAVRGWAIRAADHAPFARIDVRAGPLVVPAMTGLSRPDVVAVFDLAPHVRAGFFSTVPTDALPFGPVIVSVEGLHPDGTRETLGVRTVSVASARRTVRVLPGTSSTRVFIDPPAIIDVDGIAVLDVRGWALDDDGRPGRHVTIVVGDAAYPARYGYPRSDVVAALGLGPQAIACGFRARIGCDEIGDDDTLHAQFECSAGRFDSQPQQLPASMRTMIVPASRLAIGSIDEVAIVSDEGHFVPQSVVATRGAKLVLRGWAATKKGRARELVALFDGMHRTVIADRHQRPDTIASGGDRHSGFNVVIEIPDVDPGWHTIEVFALDDEGIWVQTSARATIIVAASSESR